MAGVLISQLEKRKKVNIIKKGVSYLLIESDDLVFKDILKFTSPCNLSKYLKQWQVTEKKSIFPYEAFSCIEEIDAQIEFPEYELFYSRLKQSNIPLQDYEEAKFEYQRCQQLPNS